MADLVFGGILVLLAYYVTRTWLRWACGSLKFISPGWRTSITFCGFVSGSLSLVLIVALVIYSIMGGTMTPGAPAWALLTMVGGLSSVIGMGAAFIGTGQLEVPTATCSGVCLLIWLAHALAS